MTNALTIKAIVVNPLAQTVTQIDMPNDFEAMKAEHLKCDTAQFVNLGMGAVAWIDEEGTLKDWSKQGWTRLAGAQFLSGTFVVTGESDDGDLADVPHEVTAELLQSVIEFVPFNKVRIPASTLTTFDENGNPKTENLGHAWRTHNTG